MGSKTTNESRKRTERTKASNEPTSKRPWSSIWALESAAKRTKTIDESKWSAAFNGHPPSEARFSTSESRKQ